MIRSFSIQTLGCKVNQYEGEQIAALLRAHGLRPTEPPLADLRIINSCSVTVQAAGKSRQLTRQATRRAVGGQAECPEKSAEPSANTSRPVRRLALRQFSISRVPSFDPAGDPAEAVAVLGPMLGPPPEPRRAEIQPPPATGVATFPGDLQDRASGPAAVNAGWKPAPQGLPGKLVIPAVRPGKNMLALGDRLRLFYYRFVPAGLQGLLG